MSNLKTILLVFITSILGFAKVGYTASSESQTTFPKQASSLLESESFKIFHTQETFHHSHAPLENQLFGIELEEKEDEEGKKKSSNYFSPTQFSHEPSIDLCEINQGKTSKSKGVFETQSIRLHLVIEKIQV